MRLRIDTQLLQPGLLRLSDSTFTEVCGPSAHLSTLSGFFNPSQTNQLNNGGFLTTLFPITAHHISQIPVFVTLLSFLLLPVPTLIPPHPTLHPIWLPLQCVLQQLDEKWLGSVGWHQVPSRETKDTHSPSDTRCTHSLFGFKCHHFLAFSPSLSKAEVQLCENVPQAF